jgi:hypothetical protein
MHDYSCISEVIQVAFTVFKEVLLLFRGSSDWVGIPIEYIVLEHEYEIEND